jgi:hypothetical protein
MVRTLKAGCLAYYDTTFSGLVPVRVVSVSRSEIPTGFYVVKAKVTEDHAAWRKGDEVESSSRWIVPRSAIKRRKYSTSILPYEVQLDQGAK